MLHNFQISAHKAGVKTRDFIMAGGGMVRIDFKLLKQNRGRETEEKEEKYLVTDTTYITRAKNFMNPLKQNRGRETEEKEEEYLVTDTTYITRANIYCSGVIEVVSARPSVKHNLEAML
jgi:hypothetical protein